jgi:hypothetical protein
MNRTLFRSFFLFSATIIIAAMSGCSTSTSPSSSGGNGGGGGLDIPVVNFGVVPAGQVRDTTISFFNNGADTVTITGDALSSTSAQDLNFTSPVSIAPNQYKNFGFQFTPTATVNVVTDSIRYQAGGKSYTALMTLEANASSGGGTGNGSLVAIPTVVNFGSLPIGQWHDTTISLVNSGSGPITIISNTVSSGEGRDTNFSGSVLIAAQSGMNIHIQFNPSQAGARSATDQIKYATGGIIETLTITLQAQGGGSTGGGGTTPGPNSMYTFDYSSVDTNGITSPHTDSTYTIVSNTLTFQGKSNVIEVRDGSGGLNYYHLEANGDISLFVDFSQAAAFASVPSQWLLIPIGSKIEQTKTLFDTSITDPTGQAPAPIAITLTTDGKDLGATDVNAANNHFACENGSLMITLSGTTAVPILGTIQVFSQANTITISYSKLIGFYPERKDVSTNSQINPSTFQTQTTTTSDTYLLKSYVKK